MLNKYNLYEKQYIQLEKRLKQIKKEINNQPYIEVPPFQKGWESIITLREDVLNRKDSQFILHLINIGYKQSKFIREIKHVRLIRKGFKYYKYKSKWDNRVYVNNFVPDKITFSKEQHQKLSEKEKKYFSKKSEYDYYNREYYYINIPDYWIKLKVIPCIYDKIMDKNGELESEYDLIYSKLTRPPYIGYYYKESSYERNYKKRKILKRIQIKEQLEEINYERKFK